MQILVADDDSTSRLILQRCIEKEGHTCWTAASGDEAWLIYQTRPVDVVISDWLMPGLDGLQLCERVRKSTTHGYTFFIMLTSLGDRDHRKIAMMAGADDFLSKPLDREDLQLRLIAAERVTTLHHRLHFQKDQFERLNQQLVEEKARAEELTQQLEQRVQDRTRQLKASSDGIRRFVPTEFLKALGYEDVSRLRLGDATARSMTILVADVHDFTQLTSGLSPEETLAWLNRCFSLLGPCIRQHGGFVHRYVEDALIALFPGDPRKAVLAAADMQRSLSTQQQADGSDRPIRIGVGVHTGTVLMGTVGEEARLETTAISEAIDQAIHVEALTRTLGCDVLFTESVELHLQQEERDRARWLGRFPFVRASRAIAIHEFFAHEEAATIARKQDSRGTMERAVGMVLRGHSAAGARLLDEILEQHPGDGAASHWRMQVQIPGGSSTSNMPANDALPLES